MASGEFVSYLRVSTAQQGSSGLGLEAQRAAVATYLNGGQWRIINEFVEVESGRSNTRFELQKAIALARLHRVPLVVAKLDRLTRSQSFLVKLLESGIEVRFCDLPQLEGPQGRFLLQSMAAVAELEAGLISSRTKAALQAAKARGRKLGGFRGQVPTDEARRLARNTRTQTARDRAAEVFPTIQRLQSTGVISLNALARKLTEMGVPTASGRDRWSAIQVKRTMNLVG